MGEPAIAVTGLHKSFGPKQAVAGIDLEIAAGFHLLETDSRRPAAGQR